MIQAVVFDFDGLIIDTETVWFNSFKEVLGRYDVEFPLEIFLPCVGTKGTIIDQYIEGKLGNKVKEIRQLVRECHREKIVDIDIREGVRDYLTQAKELGLKIGLATSSDREWIDHFLKRLNILHYFDVIKTGDDVKKVKPDPEVYLQCLDALNVSSNYVVAFEDSNNGAKAAKASGVTCVIVPNPITAKLTFDDYDMRIESMASQSLTEVLNKIVTFV